MQRIQNWNKRQKVLDFSADLFYNNQVSIDACVAQSVVQLIRNEQVARSSRVTSSKKTPETGSSFSGVFHYTQIKGD